MATQAVVFSVHLALIVPYSFHQSGPKRAEKRRRRRRARWGVEWFGPFEKMGAVDVLRSKNFDMQVLIYLLLLSREYAWGFTSGVSPKAAGGGGLEVSVLRERFSVSARRFSSRYTHIQTTQTAAQRRIKGAPPAYDSS